MAECGFGIDEREYYIGCALNALIQKYGAGENLEDPELLWIPKAIEIGGKCAAGAAAAATPTTASPTPAPVTPAPSTPAPT